MVTGLRLSGTNTLLAGQPSGITCSWAALAAPPPTGPPQQDRQDGFRVVERRIWAVDTGQSIRFGILGPASERQMKVKPVKE